MSAPSALFRLNFGEPFTDSSGNSWSTARMLTPRDSVPILSAGEHYCICDSTVLREPDLPIIPEEWSPLIRTEGINPTLLKFALPAGHYTVRFTVAETFEGLATMERKYDVIVNGQKLPKPLQPFQTAQGFARPGLFTLEHVPVADDGLQIQLDGKPYNCGTCLSGVEIFPGEAGTLTATEKAVVPQEAPILPTASPNARRTGIFFAGNSGLFFWAIPQSLQRMLMLGNRNLKVEIDGYFCGGKDAKFFAEAPEVEAGLKARPWDYAVLMDSSGGPIENPVSFEENLSRLITTAQGHGARPLLYSYNGPERFTPEQRQQLQERYVQMGKAHNVPVIPCATALNRALAAFPGQNFHNPDRHHVGMLTSFLFLCVWYRALTGQSALGLPEHSTLAGYVTLPGKWVRPLGEIADQTCLDYGLGEKPLPGF